VRPEVTRYCDLRGTSMNEIVSFESSDVRIDLRIWSVCNVKLTGIHATSSSREMKPLKLQL
jgi:hypothetical protein